MFSDGGYGDFRSGPGIPRITIPAINVPFFDLGQINISLGANVDRRDSNLGAGASALAIHLKTTAALKAMRVAQDLRRAEAQNERRIPVIAGPIRPPSPPVIRSPGATAPGLPTSTNTGNRPMGLDLGGLLGNLGGAYIDARYGQPTPVSYAPALSPVGPTTAAILGTTPALGIPFVDVIPEAGTKNMVWNPSANCGQGKWIHRQKRRRRRLATASDIKDLAALNGVTTPQQKVTWIATHPS